MLLWTEKHNLTKTLLINMVHLCMPCMRMLPLQNPTEHAPLVVARRRGTWGRGTRPCYIPRRRSHGRPLRTHRGRYGGRRFHGRRWGPTPGTPCTRLPHQHLLDQTTFVFIFNKNKRKEKKNACLMWSTKCLLHIFFFCLHEKAIILVV